MALSDYFRADLFRPRNLVPAGIAVVVVGGAWFFVRETLPDEPLPAPAPPPEAAAAADAPAPEAPPPEPEIFPTVLVANRDIARGIPLNLQLVQWQQWAEPVDVSRAVIKDAVPLQSVVGAVTRRPIASGELITWENLVMSGMPGFVTAVLTPGYRAMTVSVDEATTRAQIIYPGDRVDVILVHSPGSGGVPAEQGGVDGPVSQVIVRDVRVIAVGSATLDMNRYGTPMVGSTGIERPEPPSGETYTLEVSTMDAERIALATVTGQLTLVVRPVSGVAVDEAVARAPPAGYDDWSRPVAFSEVMPGLSPPEEEVAPPPPLPRVRIIRGRGRSSEQVVETRENDASREAAELLAEALRGG